MFKCIFLNENIWILNDISLKYVPWSPIDNMSAWVQIMAWRRPGDKPLSEPMLTQLTDAYMGTRGRWVKLLACVHPAFVNLTLARLQDAHLLLVGSRGTNFNQLLIKMLKFSLNKMHSRMLSVKCLPFCVNLNVFNTLRPRQNGRHSQTTFSSAFSWMKIFEFRLKFNWNLFLRV